MSVSIRPSYIPDDWFRCTRGMSFAHTPPAGLADDAHLASDNLWERVACITLQAQAGNFAHLDHLLECVRLSDDDHLRDCAIRVFALAASSQGVGKLAELFAHASHETRIEAYRVAMATYDLDVARALARHRAAVNDRYEKLRVMDAISWMVDSDEESDLIESPLADDTFIARVDTMINEIRERFGTAAILRGVPVDAAQMVDALALLCSEEDAEGYGGTMSNLLYPLEGLTGVPYAGCLDDDCAPVLSEVSHTLNKLRQSGILQKLEPGRRYFFGHPIP